MQRNKSETVKQIQTARTKELGKTFKGELYRKSQKVSTNGQSYRLVDDEYDEHVHCDIAVI
jgi:hypothetical protein